MMGIGILELLVIISVIVIFGVLVIGVAAVLKFLIRREVTHHHATTEKPPLSGKRIFAEIMAGGAGAGLGLLSSFFIQNVPVVGNIIGFISYTLGAAIGVYLVGNIGNETGSFKATLGGSMIVYLIISIIGGVICTFGHRIEMLPKAIALAVLASSSIGATIGFNHTSRYKQLPPASETNAN